MDSSLPTIRLSHRQTLSFHRLCLFSLCMLPLLLMGCRTGPIGIVSAVIEEIRDEPAPIKLAVKSAHVSKITDEGFRVELALELDNPNEIDLPITDIRYQIRYGGTDFRFHEKPLVTLGAEKKTAIVLPASFPLKNRKRNEISENMVGATIRVSYEPPGEIRKLMTESSVPLPTVKVEMPAPDFPESAKWQRPHPETRTPGSFRP